MMSDAQNIRDNFWPEDKAELLRENVLLHDHLHQLQKELAQYSTILEGVDKCTPRHIHYENLDIKRKLDNQANILAALWQCVDFFNQSGRSEYATPWAKLFWFLHPGRVYHYRRLKQKNYQPIIDYYKRHGGDKTKKLLAPMPLLAAARAKIWSDIARTLIKKDPPKALEYALMAWRIQPRPYRCKFLAFRLFEDGQKEFALHILEGLPPDMEFSDSEQRYLTRIRNAVSDTAR